MEDVRVFLLTTAADKQIVIVLKQCVEWSSLETVSLCNSLLYGSNALNAL